MMRGGGFPPSDPEEEKKLANAAVLGQFLTFGIVVGVIHFVPIFLEQAGFEVLV